MANADILPYRYRPYSEEPSWDSQGYHESVNPELDLRFGPIHPDVQRKLVELSETYKCATKCLGNLKHESKKYISSQILQSTYLFDDVTTILVEYSDRQDQIEALHRVEEQLKSTFIEIMMNLIAGKISSIKKCSEKPRIYYELTFFSLPEKNEITTRMEAIKRHMQRGHQLKDEDWKFCLKEFERAYEEADILMSMLPDSNTAKYRFVMILLSVISSIAGIKYLFL